MRNKRKPFFYTEKKRKSSALGFLLVFIIVLFIWAGVVPTARQLLFPPLYPIIPYLKSWIIRPIQPNARDFLNQPIYEVPELPDAEVIFAENLEALQSALNDGNTDEGGETGSAALSAREFLPTVTPTVGMNWVYVDPPQNEESGGSDPAAGDEPIGKTRLLTLPTFERADVLNDGPTALATILRAFGHTTNQYAIQLRLRPGYTAPGSSLEELAAYVAPNHPELTALRRLNGTADQIAALLDLELPILIPTLAHGRLPAYRDDDFLTRRCAVIFGKDDPSDTFSLRDPTIGDRHGVPAAELMESWYPFGREYLVVFPNERLAEVESALGEDADEQRNRERAVEKGERDVANLPMNVYARLNLVNALGETARYRDAAEAFRAAANLRLPLRLTEFVPSLYKIFFNVGVADELTAWCDFGLKLNRLDVNALIWKGWGSVLRNDNAEAEALFARALAVMPEHDAARYAVQYLAEYR